MGDNESCTVTLENQENLHDACSDSLKSAKKKRTGDIRGWKSKRKLLEGQSYCYNGTCNHRSDHKRSFSCWWKIHRAQYWASEEIQFGFLVQSSMKCTVKTTHPRKTDRLCPSCTVWSLSSCRVLFLRKTSKDDHKLFNFIASRTSGCLKH